METIEKLNIMGGEVYIEIISNSLDLNKTLLSEIKTEIIRLVNIFNFFDKKSLLSKLNIKRELEYNFELKEVIEKSFFFYNYSRFKFNPFIGKNFKLRKDNKDLNLNYNKFNLDDIIIEKNNIKIINENIYLDFGGIAKGYIAQKTSDFINNKYKNKNFSLLINARGDICLTGKKSFIIGIENPFEDSCNLFLCLKNCSIVTSGHFKQQFKFGSHIVGSQNGIASITLVSNNKTCDELDALATYLIQLPPTDCLELVEFDNYLEDVEVYLILEDKNTIQSSFFGEYLK